MRLDTGLFADQVAARVDLAARRDGARDDLRAAALPAQVDARAGVHLRAGAGHEHGVEGGNRVVAV
ncbi:hypothetical protein SDC9_148755 [bioreactor metagenome]|uniref:Uncharacterized protein n=1 Tax=bioreactor metagenome TaxID=1076179 RepID=A0A645EJC4_9ZZZZ